MSRSARWSLSLPDGTPLGKAVDVPTHLPSGEEARKALKNLYSDSQTVENHDDDLAVLSGIVIWYYQQKGP